MKSIILTLIYIVNLNFSNTADEETEADSDLFTAVTEVRFKEKPS